MDFQFFVRGKVRVQLTNMMYHVLVPTLFNKIPSKYTNVELTVGHKNTNWSFAYWFGTIPTNNEGWYWSPKISKKRIFFGIGLVWYWYFLVPLASLITTLRAMKTDFSIRAGQNRPPYDESFCELNFRRYYSWAEFLGRWMQAKLIY